MMTTDLLTRIAIINALILVPLFILIKLNIPRQARGRQVIFPVLSVVYCLVVFILLFRFLSWIEILINRFTIPFINIGLLLAVNLALMFGFIVFKGIARPIANALWKKQRLMEVTSFSFYKYEDDFSRWFLSNKWVNFRNLFKIFYICVVIACIVYIILATENFGNVSWIMFFPCAALLVISEVYNYINGITKEEFGHSIEGDEADSRRIGQYYRVREIYEKIFPGQILTAHTGCEFARRAGSSEVINELLSSSSPIDKITATYFDLINKDRFPEPDYVNATNKLMHKKSVLFFNPFYRDLGLYITLPIVSSLIRGKRCLVILGRSSTREDIKKWLADLIKEYSRMESLWRVADLNASGAKSEVGILSLMQLYDHEVIKANKEFFDETDFVLLVEPSIILTTGQIGLSLVTDEMRRREDKPVYCICDRKTEGLVDTLSHLLYSEIDTVLAMPVPRCIYAGMTWNAGGDYIRQQLFDKQTRFLGNGTELAAVAIKNQIPKVSWYSETKSPVRDVKNIAGQYHPTICRFMNLFSQQNNINEKIDFISNLWGAPASTESFVIAEDEFCNMYSLMRAYLSRGTSHIFVNILSESYLLRDYMRYNRQMFSSDPHAIPSIVPDYAKTDRNVLIKLLLYMSYRPITESEIIDELSYAGVEANGDAIGTLSGLLRKYSYVQDAIFTMHGGSSEELFVGNVVSSFSIHEGVFARHFSDTLKNAYFVVEEEERDIEYIDGKLFGHITQQLLPGQYITYDGKYYIAKMISPSHGVVLRRAYDLYDGRKFYRQIRTYKILNAGNPEIVSTRTVSDVEMTYARFDIDVLTTGYLEMNDNHDLRSARVIDFKDDPSVKNGKYERRYKNKVGMRIALPETNERTRFSICTLLSEVFRSVFPNSWPYIAVVTKQTEELGGMTSYLSYSLEIEEDDEYIYFIEDSDMDLGLLEAFERNFTQIMEIITDFLDWHFEKMREPEKADPPLPEQKEYQVKEEKRRKTFVRLADRVRQLFGGKKETVDLSPEKRKEEIAEVFSSAQPKPKEEKEEAFSLDTGKARVEADASKIQPIVEEDTVEPGDEVSFTLDSEEEAEAPEPAEPAQAPEVSVASDYYIDDDDDDDLHYEDTEYVDVDGTDIFDDEGMTADLDWLEDCFSSAGIIPLGKTRYQQECYLKYGFEHIDKRINLLDARNYLRVRGYSNNSLTKARQREALEREPLDFTASINCNFCGLPLSGISYEKLRDGRCRCNVCSSSAITSVEEFRELFYRVMGMMEGMFSISFKVPISVKMTDARTIAKGAGSIFQPTNADSRVLGYAQKVGEDYSLFCENGSPYLAAIDLIVHEMTHIWQFVNWKEAEMKNLYGIATTAIYEGMAMWASIQYLYQMGETYYAELQEAIAANRDDEYGIGMKEFRERYPFVKDSSVLKYSPFLTHPPL